MYRSSDNRYRESITYHFIFCQLQISKIYCSLPRGSFDKKYWLIIYLVVYLYQVYCESNHDQPELDYSFYLWSLTIN